MFMKSCGHYLEWITKAGDDNTAFELVVLPSLLFYLDRIKFYIQGAT